MSEQMKRFLVTAGSTREAIDQVRDWGNIFTGGTGFAIATALAEHGQVDLITSNRQHLADLERQRVVGVRGLGFRSHADLRAVLERQMSQQQYTGVFMAAAVADYSPVRTYRIVSRQPLADRREQWIVEDVQAGKVGSSYQQIAILGQRTQKLVDLFRQDWRYCGLLAKFKLEVDRTREQLIQIGRQSRTASGADYLVANTLDMVEGEGAGAYLIGEDSQEWVPRAALARRLAELARLHKSTCVGASGGYASLGINQFAQ